MHHLDDTERLILETVLPLGQISLGKMFSPESRPLFWRMLWLFQRFCFLIFMSETQGIFLSTSPWIPGEVLRENWQKVFTIIYKVNSQSPAIHQTYHLSVSIGLWIWLLLVQAADLICDSPNLCPIEIWGGSLLCDLDFC